MQPGARIEAFGVASLVQEVLVGIENGNALLNYDVSTFRQGCVCLMPLFFFRLDLG